ncbi:hypothetical protein IFT74_07260 [Oxalobacteraceae sp. CFBP 8755]|nr:hypothetical protein [Oxalobacteraceae sp. CFBP 8755]
MQISNIQMDPWVLRQLRGRVLEDLLDHIPKNYFESEKDKFQYDSTFIGSKSLSYEMRWGYLAGELGRQLYFHSDSVLSARQISASEVLMHLGILAAVEASRNACEQLSKKANDLNVADGNSTVVAAQMRTEHIPTLQLNLLGGVRQYLLHLTSEEAKPFTSIIQNTPLAPIHLF